MKKKLALCFSLLTLVSLVGCGGDKTSVDPSTTDKGSTDVEKGVIKFTETKVEIERSGTKTVRVNTAGLLTDDKTVTFSSEEDGKIIKLAEQGSGDVAIKVTGIRIGTATLKATSVADPSVSATITISVVAQKSALRTVWNKVIANNNYTISSYDPDVSEDEPSSVLKVTEKAAILVDKDDNALISTKIASGDDDESTEDVSLYGIGISSNDLAYYIIQKEDGSFYTPANSITTAKGLLRSSNFVGAGTGASSFLDVSTVYGLQAVNPDWLTKVKNEDNTYEIDGSDTDVNSAYTEALLWGIVDPLGKEELINEKFSGSYTAPEAASLIDTTITVIDNTTVSITITESESQKTHVAYMSNVGTTVLPSVVNTYVETGAESVAKPALNSGLTAIVAALNKDDFSIEENMTYGKYSAYYTPTYYWNGVTSEIAAAYKAKFSEDLASTGYAVLNDGIYQFTLTESAETDGEPTITFADTRASVSTDLPYALGYFSSMDSLQEDGDDLYTFRALTSASGATVYYSSAQSVSDDICPIYLGGTLPELMEAMQKYGYDYVFEDYGTSITPSYGKDSEGNPYVSSVEFGLGTFSSNGNSGYAYPFDVSLEPASKTNKYDSAILAAIEAKKNA